MHQNNHPTNHLTNHPTTHSTNHPTNHLTNHPTTIPTNHPANHPTNHPSRNPDANTHRQDNNHLVARAPQINMQHEQIWVDQDCQTQGSTCSISSRLRPRVGLVLLWCTTTLLKTSQHETHAMEAAPDSQRCVCKSTQLVG